ncbi:MAG: hypothetical protein WBZ36_06050, partial [Candidatus Nitrosopolaris sp.]
MHGKKISHTTLAIAEKVYDAAQQEPATFGQIWTDLNSEKISPYKNMQRIQTRQNEKVEPQRSTTRGNALIMATHKLIKDSRIVEKEFLTADLVLERRKSMLRCSTGSKA